MSLDWKTRYEELQQSYDDFVSDSKEVEAELEKEVNENKQLLTNINKKYDSLKTQNDKLTQEYNEYQNKTDSKIKLLNNQLTELTDSHTNLNKRYRLLESEKDQLENKLRIANATIQDLQEEIEETAELHIMAKTELEETIKLHKETESRLKLKLQEFSEVSIENLQKEKNNLLKELESIKDENQKLNNVSEEYQRKMNLFQATSNRRASLANLQGRSNNIISNQLILNSIANSTAASTATSRRGSIANNSDRRSVPVGSSFFANVSNLLNQTAHNANDNISNSNNNKIVNTNNSSHHTGHNNNNNNSITMLSNLDDHPTLWLETDLSVDDCFALFLIVKRSFIIHGIVVGEGRSEVKVKRIKKYMELLTNHNNNYKEIIYIQGMDSKNQFPQDGEELKILNEITNNEDSIKTRKWNEYPSQFSSYIQRTRSTQHGPLLLVIKPPRELFHFYKELKAQLAEVTLYIYGSYNFRCLMDDYSIDFILTVLNSFKRVIIYENFYAYNEQEHNIIDSTTMPSFLTVFQNNCSIDTNNPSALASPTSHSVHNLSSPTQSSYHLNLSPSSTLPHPNHKYFLILDQLLKNYNNNESNIESNKSKESNGEQSNKMLINVDDEFSNTHFYLTASDIGLATVMQNMQFDCFVKRSQLKFETVDSKMTYTKLTPLDSDSTEESKIYCYYNIPWTLLQEQLVSFFSPPIVNNFSFRMLASPTNASKRSVTSSPLFSYNTTGTTLSDRANLALSSLSIGRRKAMLSASNSNVEEENEVEDSTDTAAKGKQNETNHPHNNSNSIVML